MRFPSVPLLLLTLSALIAGCGGGGGGSSAAMLGANATWITQMGGPGFAQEGPGSVVALSDGGAIVTGNHIDMAVFGVGEPTERVHRPSPQARAAAYIARLDAQGRLLWSKTLDGLDDDVVLGLEAFPDGGFAIVGHVHGTLFLGFDEPNETLIGSPTGTAFVARYEADGTLRWARQIDGSDTSARPVIATDGLRDQLYVGLTFDGPVTLDPDPMNPRIHEPLSERDWLIAAYGAYGSLAWSRQGYSQDASFLTSIDVGAGDVVGVGGFAQSLGLDPFNPREPRLLAGNAIYHGFAVRLDGHTGATRWLKRLGSASLAVPGHVDVSETGRVAAVGVFTNRAAFGLGEPGETVLDANGAINGFIAQLDTFGDLEWVVRYTGAPLSTLPRVHVDDLGETILATEIRDTARFAPGELIEQRFEADGQDFVIVRYSADGKLQDAVQHGGPGDQISTDFDRFTDGALLVVGKFETQAEIGGGTPRDVMLMEPGPDFIARLRPDGRR